MKTCIKNLVSSLELKNKPSPFVIAMIAIAGFVHSGLSQTWNAGAPWSAAQNPNGAWSSGSRSSQNRDEFTLSTPNPKDQFWLPPGCNSFVSIQGPPPSLWADDNSAGYPVVRWTCPETGDYYIASSFVWPGFVNEAANLVWVVTDGSPLFSGSIQVPKGTREYTHILTFEAGAYVDFVGAC